MRNATKTTVLDASDFETAPAHGVALVTGRAVMGRGHDAVARHVVGGAVEVVGRLAGGDFDAFERSGCETTLAQGKVRREDWELVHTFDGRTLRVDLRVIFSSVVFVLLCILASKVAIAGHVALLALVR
jgi:hypothetical protein